MQMHFDQLDLIAGRHYGKFQQKTGQLQFLKVSLQQMQSDEKCIATSNDQFPNMLFMIMQQSLYP